MASIKKFEDLDVWILSRDLNSKLGKIIHEKQFINNNRLVWQMQGSAGSIMDNIAEGFERGTRAEFIQFLGYSKGSCGELRSQLYRASDLQYITIVQFEELLNLTLRISSMIQKFIQYLQKSNLNGVRKKL